MIYDYDLDERKSTRKWLNQSTGSHKNVRFQIIGQARAFSRSNATDSNHCQIYNEPDQRRHLVGPTKQRFKIEHPDNEQPFNFLSKHREKLFPLTFTVHPHDVIREKLHYCYLVAIINFDTRKVAKCSKPLNSTAAALETLAGKKTNLKHRATHRSSARSCYEPLFYQLIQFRNGTIITITTNPIASITRKST